MMNNYVDMYSRYHHKEVTISNPIPSGNGWLYTAYAAKAGLEIDYGKLSQCFDDCTEVGSDGLAHLNRSPGKSTPPISRDEILGMIYLFGEGDSGDGIEQDWNFSPFPIPKFSALQLIKQLYELRPEIHQEGNDSFFNPFKCSLVFKHRNYFWQNNLDQLYRFAFSVPVQDRYFILKTWDKYKWYKPSHVFYRLVAKIDSMLPKKSGIKWLKYGGEENMKEMVKEFPTDHPIRIKLGV